MTEKFLGDDVFTLMAPKRRASPHLFNARSWTSLTHSPLISILVATSLTAAAVLQVHIPELLAAHDAPAQQLAACAARQIGVPQQQIAVSRDPWTVYQTDDNGIRMVRYRLDDDQRPVGKPMRPQDEAEIDKSAALAPCFAALTHG